jgi:gamma-glutamyltranspeptidase/glutathione hydrolase
MGQEKAIMDSHRHSRREFLQRGSAAMTAGGALGAFSGGVLADTLPSKSAKCEGRQAVACSRQEAAEAARATLQQGGNAIDAAVAALLVQCVIEPSNVGLGGYGGSLVYYQAKTGRVHAIDFDSRAPRRFDPATFSEAASLRGYLAVGTPGVVAGIDLALRQFGTMPFKSLAAPALALAENGFPVTPKMAASFDGLLKSIDPVSRQAFFPDGVPAEGSTWVHADLARLIRRLGDEGPASFYKGEIPRAIARQVQAGGGVLAADDFHDFQATVVEPLHISYRGFDLYTPPLPSGGLTSLSILKTLEQFDVANLSPWGAEYAELFASVSNLAWAERFKYCGDPDFVDVPVEELLSEKRAVERAEILRKGTPAAHLRPVESSHTVNLVVADAEQNIVSWTATHGGDYGAHVAIEGLGLMLGHGMSRFSATQGDPNYPAPGKRPQHNMAPLLVLRDGMPRAALGLPGGRFIVTVTAQLAASLIDFKAAPQQIVSAPRIHTEGAEPIQVTSGMSKDAVEQLRQRGHAVVVKPAIGAGANAVVIDPKTGGVQAAASQGPHGVVVF